MAALAATGGTEAKAEAGAGAEAIAAPIKTVEGSRVKMIQVAEGANCDMHGFLTTGCILKWMDICTCLAAERHCHTNCVTISMDDLQIENDVALGDIVMLVGQVNNAFNTSMEVGVTVQSESRTTGRVQMVRLKSWRLGD